LTYDREGNTVRGYDFFLFGSFLVSFVRYQRRKQTGLLE